MGALGLMFLLVVLGQSLARDSGLVTLLSIVGWTLWSVFVAEFALRAWIARDQRRFWARNWWQVVFLAVPFLRFARAFSLLRAARVGGVLSAAVRGSRSAGRLLSGRVGWLGVVTGVVVLASSQLQRAGGGGRARPPTPAARRRGGRCERGSDPARHDRRSRDFSSTSTLRAERYDLVADADFAVQARRLLTDLHDARSGTG